MHSMSIADPGPNPAVSFALDWVHLLELGIPDCLIGLIRFDNNQRQHKKEKKRHSLLSISCAKVVFICFYFILCSHCKVSIFHSHLKNIFNWKITALQYCVGFCHITMQISYNYYIYMICNIYIYIYIYISSLSLEPPCLLPFHPSRSSQRVRLGSLCYTAASH